MNETEIKFEREELDGTVAVGTYLLDAARRLGVEVECDRLGLSDSCAMTVGKGGDLLTPLTKAELELLDETRRKNGERMACQAKIGAPGEISITTKEKIVEKEVTEDERSEQYREEFEQLPLEKKVAALVKLEAVTLGETFSFILNSPNKIVGKVMDVMAEFGLKMDEEEKNATRPVEHQANGDGDGKQNGAANKTTKKAANAKTASEDSVVEAVEDVKADAENEADVK